MSNIRKLSHGGMYVNAGVVCGADTYVKIAFNSQEEREPFKIVQVVPAFSSSLYKSSYENSCSESSNSS